MEQVAEQNVNNPSHSRGVALIESEADIRRSPEDVFDYCSDHTHEPEWNIKMKHVDKLTDGPMRVGSRFEMEFIPGHPMVVECSRFERPTAWEMVGESMGMRFGLGGRVSARGDGAHLVMRMEVRPQGIFGLAAPLLRRRLQPDFVRDVATIKVILEETRTSGGPRHADG